MSHKTYKQQVQDIYPKATHKFIDIGQCIIHIIYSTGKMDGRVLGQSSSSERDAWGRALFNIKSKT